jgi:LmbE family N-acetylglucosaminyl deacetylase
VYTTGPPLAKIAPAMRQFADYAKRRAEDDAACAVVGAEVRRLDQIERAFRPPFLTGWAFFATPAKRSGFGTLAQVRRAIDPLRELDADRILIPFGVGNHIDHVEAMVAATDWALANDVFDRVWFYEDFYAISGTMRAKHPIARRRMWKRWQSPLLRARRLAVILRAIAAARRGPSVEDLLAPALRGARWAVSRSDIRAFEKRKLDAIACYRSQTRAFGGLAGIARALRVYHAWWGGAEPLWRATLA